jgi:hypothetical protein
MLLLIVMELPFPSGKGPGVRFRGDLTLSVQQRRLEQRLYDFGGKLGG